jgi:hypothetical protein
LYDPTLEDGEVDRREARFKECSIAEIAANHNSIATSRGSYMSKDAKSPGHFFTQVYSSWWTIGLVLLMVTLSVMASFSENENYAPC